MDSSTVHGQRTHYWINGTHCHWHRPANYEKLQYPPSRAVARIPPRRRWWTKEDACCSLAVMKKNGEMLLSIPMNDETRPIPSSFGQTITSLPSQSIINVHVRMTMSYCPRPPPQSRIKWKRANYGIFQCLPIIIIRAQGNVLSILCRPTTHTVQPPYHRTISHGWGIS